MMTVLAFTVVWGVLSVGPAQEAAPIRRGWNSYGGEPYNFCNWLVVTGPEAAARGIREQAKKAYAEPSATKLAAVAGKVFIEILTTPERGRCSNRVMTEVIFVDKASDQPVLRRPIESKEVAMSNGFGATWQSNDGLAVADVASFSALTGSYHVVVVYVDGGSERIGQGAGGTVWSGNHTKQVR